MKVGDRKENDSDHYNIICNLERNVRLDRLIPGKQKIHHLLVMRERDQNPRLHWKDYCLEEMGKGNPPSTILW
jgi:hypothetical protein